MPESAGTPSPTPVPGAPTHQGPGASPQTGDRDVDAALVDLAAVDPADLDALLAAGESVHVTLTSRLSDLGS